MTTRPLLFKAVTTDFDNSVNKEKNTVSRILSNAGLDNLPYDNDTKKTKTHEIYQLLICMQMIYLQYKTNTNTYTYVINPPNLFKDYTKDYKNIDIELNYDFFANFIPRIKRPTGCSGYDFELIDDHGKTHKIDITLGNLNDSYDFIIEKIETKRSKSDNDILIFYIALGLDTTHTHTYTHLNMIRENYKIDCNKSKLPAENIYIFDAHNYFNLNALYT
jgi:hypothetical protein